MSPRGACYQSRWPGIRARVPSRVFQNQSPRNTEHGTELGMDRGPENPGGCGVWQARCSQLICARGGRIWPRVGPWAVVRGLEDGRDVAPGAVWWTIHAARACGRIVVAAISVHVYTGGSLIEIFGYEALG